MAMLTKPTLCGPVMRTLLNGARPDADAVDQCMIYYIYPSEGVEQSWNWWQGLPADGADQS